MEHAFPIPPVIENTSHANNPCSTLKILELYSPFFPVRLFRNIFQDFSFGGVGCLYQRS